MITDKQIDQLTDDAPTMTLDPIVRVVELDARIRVAVDVRRLATLSDHGEPSTDELQAYLLALVKTHLAVQPYFGNVRVSWINIDTGLIVDIDE